MIRRSRWSVFLTLLFALGQLSLPASLSISDALASNDGRAMVGHVEGGSGTGCRAPHPDDCAVCRYLTTLAAPALTATVHCAQAGESERTAFADSRAPSPNRRGFLSRAPPAISA